MRDPHRRVFAFLGKSLTLCSVAIGFGFVVAAVAAPRTPDTARTSQRLQGAELRPQASPDEKPSEAPGTLEDLPELTLRVRTSGAKSAVSRVSAAGVESQTTEVVQVSRPAIVVTRSAFQPTNTIREN